MATARPFKISTPGTLVGLLIGLDSLDDGDTVDTVSGSASDGDLTINNEGANDAAETIDGVTYEIGEAIRFDVTAASGMTPGDFTLYFTYTTANGESIRVSAEIQVVAYVVTN